jgi:Xaa-Pro aminopeptidase
MFTLDTHEFEFDLEITDNILPICKARRDQLVATIRKEYDKKSGIVVLPGNFENGHDGFVQDSTFWYFTGIAEPGCVCVIDLENGKSILFVPHYKAEKGNWDSQHITKESSASTFFVDEIRLLGDEISSMSLSPRDVSPRGAQEVFKELISYTMSLIKGDGMLCMPFPHKNTSYAIDLFQEHFKKAVGVTENKIFDITKIIALLRMKKDEQEVARLYQAIDVTISAHEAAVSCIADEISENEVAASAEFLFTANGCTRSFPTIVAGGKNATTLHYYHNKSILKDGSLVLIDMGARYEYYCADLSRTYPVSGKFTKRQKELYAVVLEIQDLVSESAKPGWYLNNKEHPEKSLQHYAVSLFKSYKLDSYFIHGIGHHLGLDTHDTADYKKPLEVGNVITIEPGLYIKEENIGIRIEDNYLITENGAICLSENLPKTVEDIENMMKKFSKEENFF